MKLIAHACGPTVYPSNSILSAKEALKNGADAVELDVQFTLDRKLAVFHDGDLMKKFGVAKKCREVMAQEFLSLRRTEDPACPGHLLDHYFQCGVGPILLDLHDETLEEVVALVEKYGYGNWVIFGLHKVESLTLLKSLLPEAQILAFIRDPEEIEAFCRAGAHVIRLWERWLTPENAARVKKCGAELWVMVGGPDTPYRVGRPDREGLLRVAAMEPDGLLVNDIPFVRGVLEK